MTDVNVASLQYETNSPLPCVGAGADVGHCVLDEGPGDEAEADVQVHVNGLDELVNVGQGLPSSGGSWSAPSSPLVAKETRVANIWMGEQN